MPRLETTLGAQLGGLLGEWGLCCDIFELDILHPSDNRLNTEVHMSSLVLWQMILLFEYQDSRCASP